MRPAIAHIRLDAFRHNYQLAKQMHGGKALAVIKANAYGHGAVQCAKAIANEADGFAVACLEEALQLRQAGIQHPILLLEGFFDAAELPEIVAQDLWIVVHAEWQLDILLTIKLAKPIKIWLKMDSGMHRVGLSPEAFISAYAQLSQHKNIANIVLMSHFANADNSNSQHTNQQIATFKQTVAKIGNSKPLSFETTMAKSLSLPEISLCNLSLCNSAAILGWPAAYQQWSRPGIMLYGADPLMTHDTKLRAVMQLSSKIIAIRPIKQGESIGYGSIFTAQRESIVGVVAIGYADGYPRAATNAPAAVDGVMTNVIGRVSMDMLFVDLTNIAQAKIGSQVELWGEQIAANDVAKAAGTIAYELFCNVKRVQFNYTDA